MPNNFITLNADDSVVTYRSPFETLDGWTLVVLAGYNDSIFGYFIRRELMISAPSSNTFLVYDEVISFTPKISPETYQQVIDSIGEMNQGTIA